MRLFGLTSKVVVLDEGHAYDTYMTTLLERLLEWLGALGTSVVLLSATLPEAKRRQLAEGFGKGIGKSDPNVPVAQYPRITWMTPDDAGAVEVKAAPVAARKIRLRWIDRIGPRGGADPFSLGRLLDEATSTGGCTAVICNTVREAQDMYMSLKQYFSEVVDGPAPTLDLFHAQYRFDERAERERRVLERFGVADSCRPVRSILVATQVIEQSLDLDFDLMLSQMAPVDLIMQRAGRLHRHHRDRPRGLREPQLWLFAPVLDESAVPHFGRRTEAVYDRHVLLRSWMSLRDLDSISIPEQMQDLIEHVYDDSRSPDGETLPLRHAWEETRRALDRTREEHESQAKLAAILPPNYPGDILEDFSRDLAEDTLSSTPRYRL